jgi:ABC-type lipoprotein release transport system permease subunit
MDVQTATVVIAGISVVIAAINSIISSRRAARNDQLTTGYE